MSQVKQILNQSLYDEVSDNETHDDHPGDGTVDHNPPGPNTTLVLPAPPAPGQVEQGTMDVLAAELNHYKECKKKLEHKLTVSNNKIIQLENEAATGNDCSFI